LVTCPVTSEKAAICDGESGKIGVVEAGAAAPAAVLPGVCVPPAVDVWWLSGPGGTGASAPEHAADSDDPITKATIPQLALIFFIR
jgi:hypothetical protein